MYNVLPKEPYPTVGFINEYYKKKKQGEISGEKVLKDTKTSPPRKKKTE
jgi:hypothetical protein